jgi:hypothetical protein
MIRPPENRRKKIERADARFRPFTCRGDCKVEGYFQQSPYRVFYVKLYRNERKLCNFAKSLMFDFYSTQHVVSWFRISQLPDLESVPLANVRAFFHAEPFTVFRERYLIDMPHVAVFAPFQIVGVESFSC